MAVLFSAAIGGARILMRDVRVPYRIADADMLAFGKAGIVEAAALRPDLFKVDGTFNCVAGLTQTLPNAGRSLYLIDVYESIIAGVRQPVMECSLPALRRYRWSWTADAAAQAENWMRFPTDGGKRDDTKFFVYPQAPGASQSLYASWVEVPDMSAYTTASEIPLTDDYAPAMEQYIAYRAEVINDEAAAKERAAAFYANFRTLLKLAETKPEA